ncbi:MAG: 2-dehydropantoate 2-reductase [Natronospirillum sp.]|uniref:ketopantoate reductase family protein n=1 Tax=Natronospirillum sp. TaxID=2812955 RepID=UPI0025D7D291|nr:2-dehydropantoate 2-reductase [Natronospirillum sp.]MCH8552536.1 2-dehydropantoate 2-reductase [Natronospirillum sp.]
MKFLIVGAGGIGCYYGARLQTAGHEVVFQARGQHLRAMQDRGLLVRHADFFFDGMIDAVDQARLTRDFSCDDFDTLILCFKSQATADWLQGMNDWLANAATPILSLQNGVDNEALVEQAVGRARTLGGLAVRIGGHITEPGTVEVDGPAQVIFGLWPDAEQGESVPGLPESMEQAFSAAGIPTTLSPNIQVELWRKLMLNNSLNPLSAITGLDTRSLCAHPYYGPVVKAIMRETLVAGQADGIELQDKDVDEMFDLISTFDAIKTSMLVDREKGRPLELDGICGPVLARAAQHDLAVPLTGLVYALLDGQQTWHRGPSQPAAGETA